MPEISRDDVAHLAGLARIQLDEDELDRLGRELPKILESVATVSHRAAAAGTSGKCMTSAPIKGRSRISRVRAAPSLVGISLMPVNAPAPGSNRRASDR